MDTDRLFELAFRFKKTALWKSIFEDQLFAVELSGGRTGYVSITGSMGDHIAASVYIGEQGLRCYLILTEYGGVLDDGYNPAFLNNSCLQVILDDKEYLLPAEIEAAQRYAKRNGIKLSGRDAYPHFWHIAAGYYPHPVNEEADVLDLITALEAALTVAQGPFVNGFDYRDFEHIGRNSREVPLVSCENGRCTMKMTELPEIPDYEPPKGEGFDELAAARLRKLQQKGVLQADLMIIPVPAEWEQNGAQIIPTVLCVIDDKTGMAINVQSVALYEQRSYVMLNKFMEALETAGFVPAEIKVADEYTEALLSGWCEKMGIALRCEEFLPELQKYKMEMMLSMTDGHEISEEMAEMNEMLEYLLGASPQEFELLADVFGPVSTAMAEEMNKHPEFPEELRMKMYTLQKHIERAKTESEIRNKGNKSVKGNAGKKRGKSHGRHKTRAYVVSVSLGTGCYRHIRVNDTETLSDFADYILQAFDFYNDHLHAFFMNNRCWSIEDAYYCEDADESYCPTTEETALYKAVKEAGHKFKFLYDYGDEWVFQCRLLRIEDSPADYPEVIRSKGDTTALMQDMYDYD